MIKIINYLIIISFSLYIFKEGFGNLAVIFTTLLVSFTLNKKYIFKRYIHKKDKQYIYFYFSLMTYILFSAISNFWNGINILSGLFWWVMLFVYLGYFKQRVDFRKINYLYIFLITAAAILIFDFYYRINLSDKLPSTARGFNLQSFKRNFYYYKFGIIDMDSNYSGLYSSLCLGVSLYASKKENKYKKFIFIFFALSILTFSRVSILSVIVTFILLNSNKILKKIMIPIFFLIFFIFTIYIFHDPSGMSKVFFINEFLKFEYIDNISDIFWGVGLNKGLLWSGKRLIAPHLLPIKLFMEQGVFVFIFYCMLLFNIYKIVGRNILYIYLPFLITSLSVAPVGNCIFTLLILYFICEGEVENEQFSISSNVCI